MGITILFATAGFYKNVMAAIHSGEGPTLGFHRPRQFLAGNLLDTATSMT
jgi:hypothetical protein